MVTTQGDLERWDEAFLAFPMHFADRFTRQESREPAAKSLRGLVALVEREQLADGGGGGRCHPRPQAAAALPGRRGGRCGPGPPAGLRVRDLG
jgi:hypothetical protein